MDMDLGETCAFKGERHICCLVGLCALSLVVCLYSGAAKI